MEHVLFVFLQGYINSHSEICDKQQQKTTSSVIKTVTKHMEDAVTTGGETVLTQMHI